MESRVVVNEYQKLEAITRRVFGLDESEAGPDRVKLTTEAIQRKIDEITPMEAYEALMPLANPGLDPARTCSFFNNCKAAIKGKANLLCSQVSDIEVKESICSSLAQKITRSAVRHFTKLPSTANNASIGESVSVGAGPGAGAITSEDSAADDSADSDTDASADSDTAAAAAADAGAQAGGGSSVPGGSIQAKATKPGAKIPAVVDPIDAILLGSKAIEAEQAAIVGLAAVEQAFRLPITDLSGLKVPITNLRAIADSCKTLGLHQGFEKHKTEILRLLNKKEKNTANIKGEANALFEIPKIEDSCVREIDSYIKQSVERQLRRRPEMVVDLQKRHLFVFVNTLLLRLYILVEEINTLSKDVNITAKKDGDNMPNFVGAISSFADNFAEATTRQLNKALGLLKSKERDEAKLHKLLAALTPLAEHDKLAFGPDVAGSNSIDNAVLNKVFLFMQRMLKLVVDTKKISDGFNPSPWVEIHNFNNLMSSYAGKRNQKLAVGREAEAGRESEARQQLQAWNGDLFVSSMETVTANLGHLSHRAEELDCEDIFLNALKIIINYMSFRLNGALSDGGDSACKSDELYSIFCSQLLPGAEELTGIKCAGCGLQELKDMFGKFFIVIRELNNDSYDASKDTKSFDMLADIKACLKKMKLNMVELLAKRYRYPHISMCVRRLIKM